MLRVYGTVHSRAFRVLWLLEELEIEYELISVDMSKGEHLTAAYQELNPLGKVPCLQDGSCVIAESAAILTYLGDRFSERQLIPAPGTCKRALHDQWMASALTALEVSLGTLSRHQEHLPVEKRLPAAADMAKDDFKSQAEVLARGLGGKDFMLGDALQVVDVLLGSLLNWAVNVKAPGVTDTLDAYIKRLRARAAYQRVLDKHIRQKPT